MTPDPSTPTSRIAPTSAAPTHVVGCDVGKAAIVVFDTRDARTRTVPNNPKALTAFAATLDPGCLVVCEATGGYESPLLQAMVDAGRPAHRADARKVKAFIRSFGTLGKTDAIDARALARYGGDRHAQLPRWQAADAPRDSLQALVLARRDLVDQRVATANRLVAPGAAAIKPHLTRMLACLNEQIAAITADVKALLAAHPLLAARVRRLRTIKGMGLLTAVAVVALMPELGTMDRRQAASLAGLAPHPSQSGATERYRRTKGGRPEIRKVLFMAALTAARRDAKMKAFYDSLLARGKKKLVATVAVMRKIIVIANAILRPEQLTAA